MCALCTTSPALSFMFMSARGESACMSTEMVEGLYKVTRSHTTHTNSVRTIDAHSHTSSVRKCQHTCPCAQEAAKVNTVSDPPKSSAAGSVTSLRPEDGFGDERRQGGSFMGISFQRCWLACWKPCLSSIIPLGDFCGGSVSHGWAFRFGEMSTSLYELPESHWSLPLYVALFLAGAAFPWLAFRPPAHAQDC
eukprot:scaffold212273_cov21-Tisochrysis_lutea.AAC.2